MKPGYRLTYKLARRIVIGVVGTTVLLVGIALTVLPGPAFIVIPLGLGILGIEFAWARRWLRKFQQKVGDTARSVLDRRNDEPAPTQPPVRHDDFDRH
ncbi:MAG: PGPGW domain-containing protein [Gammaproteobacteria bacterium]|nr:PGPGW domain-containing protein [Gammaproteobacteria bacterium]